MPKEKIYDTSDLFDIEVGWARNQMVQLGITTHDGQSLAEWLGGQGALEGGHVPPSHPDAEDGLPLPQFKSLWATLDRAGINRLIRNLRKARDEAYGRDE